MHGTVDTITETMEVEKVKNSISNYIEVNKKRLKKIFYIAMAVLVAVIAIILVDSIKIHKANILNDSDNNVINNREIKFDECQNEEIVRFINEYFKAKTDSNYTKIFASFGKDYQKEMQRGNEQNLKRILENLNYERAFVRGYDDIKVYSEDGLNENETICLVTYELELGFTSDKAPMIIIFYIENKNGIYNIKDNLDVGTSKFIMACINTDVVKKIYTDVSVRLNRLLVSSESLKLAYNSLRQAEINSNSTLGIIRSEISNEYGINKYDQIEDITQIERTILDKKEKEEKINEVNRILGKLIASVSVATK